MDWGGGQLTFAITARALARELRAQVEEYNLSIPNDPERLTKHNDLVAFLEKMAAGLDQLANALDQAVIKGRGGKPEPAFLGEAGKIARQLHLGLMEWLVLNRVWLIDKQLKIALIAAGLAFFESWEVAGTVAFGGLATLILKQPSQTKVAGKKVRPSSRKATGKKGTPKAPGTR